MMCSLMYGNIFNPLNAQLNPICRLLALLGAHPILHISRIRVNILKKRGMFQRVPRIEFQNYKFINIVALSMKKCAV